MQSYHEMTSAQARAYFDQFMSEMDGSRERLAHTLSERGADPALADDRSPESLQPMWEALSPLLVWQDGWDPDETRPTSQPILEALGDPHALPSWLDPVSGPIQWSPATLWIVDGVGRHLGNVMAANVPGMRWSLGPNRARTSHRNQPVIRDQGQEDHSPLEGVANLATRILDPLASASTSLRDYYEMRAAYWRAGAPSPPASDSAAAQPSSPEAPDGCECGEHAAEVVPLTIPFARASEDTDVLVTVADLVAWDALGADEVQDGHGKWLLWFGDETRRHYDDDAPMALEDVVASAPGVGDAVREDRETIRVSAPHKCRDAMLAIAARALLDSRVRLHDIDS